MPAQKRSADETHDNDDDLDQHDISNDHDQHSPGEEGDAANESDRSPLSSDGEKEEYVLVKLSELRKEVQCPICLGIIRKTRTVMECLHRFCRECIDKSMRLGNNECPACRTHCASRRSLRDDPKYDALIAALYPDIDKYEEEELALHEEEKARNKQIQASISQTLKRQSEAIGRKRSAKSAAAAVVRRSHSRFRDIPLRGRRNHQTELQGSDENEDADGDGEKNSSSADERGTEVIPKRSKRLGGAQSSAGACADGGGDENGSEMIRESLGSSVGLLGPSEMLAWGGGGMRSHTRYGSLNGGNGKNPRGSRISRLVDHLQNLEEKDDELDIHFMLVSFDEERIPNLERPYLWCRPSLSVGQLCQYVAGKTESRADEIEIYLVKELRSNVNPSTLLNDQISKSSVIDPCKDKLQVLDEGETLAGLTTQNFSHGYLLLAYQKKFWNSKW
ncbi:putative E3 ubiquitin-protein ligase RING1a isoform X2 [Carica papaya]|uniref:putative E3 ubiquitin-protein ligase RING1a isoform X2 n=1 Tax=Carica papaya TaxID=3649 RepID=UPI000B8CC644|nr:putative E3 ubiquitin-protein ligase RING1a isoform X2 [Carica papaya]XP_021911139.1 putative E3 ubiquitin-protein ligase RING1a isoform X2 [Carica papaya]